MPGKRNPGPLGEDTLRIWAHEEGATINRADDDRSGWDFILEFPNQFSGASRNEEREESQYQCLIQVKSTDVGQQYSQIRLGNMKRLVESPLPAFILFLSFAGTRTCESAYLVHIGEGLVARTLERVRRLVVQDGGDEISKRTMRVKWTENDKLLTCTGEALLDRITSVVGASLVAYSRTKARALQSVGYGSGSARASVNVVVPDKYRQLHPEELLVDAKLGLIGDLDVSKGEVRTFRFGIPGRKLAELGSGAKMSIGLPSPSAEGELVVRSHDLEKVARVRTAVRGARSEAGLGEGGIVKVRLDLPFSYFTISLPAMVGTFTFAIPNEEESISLQEAKKLASIFSVLEHAATTGIPVSMELDGNHIGTLGPLDLDSIRQFSTWARLVGDGHSALQALDIEPSVNVTLRDLSVQKDALQIIRASRFGQIPNGTVFLFRINEGAEPEVGEEMCLPISFDIRLGEITVSAFVSLIGNVSNERSPGGEYLVHVERIEIDRVVHVGDNLRLPRERIEYFREIAHSRGDRMGVLCWWESKAKWHEDEAGEQLAQ